jgi:NAD(P)-dependent dehydrogenase (short-subunit alcohol dehydrogenase family)
MAVAITGASAGVGRAVARRFAERGFAVGLIARGTDGLGAARKEMEQAGVDALVVEADVSDAAAVDDAAARIESELGPLDVWVNNAMAGVLSPFERMTPEEFARVTEVTYIGVVNGTRAALRRMRPRGRGTIVQVGSALAYRGIPLQSAYCGAKHAIKGFTESLRTELAHDKSNVRLTMIQLPALNTTQFGWVRNKMPREPRPVPPIYQPEVAADAIVWAATRRRPRREVHVGGSTVATIWANKLIPGLLDGYLGRTGFKSQQTDRPAEPHPDYLFAPVPGDHGAHGCFDDRAHDRSVQVAVTKWRSMVSEGLRTVFGGDRGWRS